MRTTTARIDDTDPHERPAPILRPDTRRRASRSLAWAALLAGSVALLPAAAGAVAPGAKTQRVVPASANAEKRESPYVRYNRQHLEAARAAPSNNEAQPPPRLAGQVQRR